MKKVVAMIPIKLHNVRLPGKNVKPLGDRALCQYLFETVKKVDNIDEVYVYCSDESICRYIPEGIRFLKRPEYLDSDTVKSKQILESFVSQVPADIYVLLHVTQPFIKADTIQLSINKVLCDNYDSAFAAHEIREFTWYNGHPLNYSLSDVVRTQDLEPVYVEGEMFVFEKEVLTKFGRRIGEKPYIHPITQFEGICIDDIDDFLMAQAVIELKKAERPDTQIPLIS